MRLSKKIFDEIRGKVEKALEQPDLELEARITQTERSLDRTGFERLIRYLSRTKDEYEPPHVSLDIGMGAHRASIHDSDRIAEQCANWKRNTLAQMYEQSPDDITVIRKEPIHKRVDVPEYNVIVWLKMETRVEDPSDPLKSMSSQGRLLTFRLKKRYSFATKDGAFRIDCTVVKAAYGAKSIDALVGAKETFEVEVELVDPGAFGDRAAAAPEAAKALMSHVAEALAVLRDQKSGELMTATERNSVRSSFSKLTGGRMIMPKPVTLERGNLMPETADYTTIREDGSGGRYTVTDKADGARFVLYVDADGKGYLMDDRGNVQRTSISSPGAANSVLDGELVKRSRLDAPLNLFLAFDVYWFRGKDVRELRLVNLDDPGDEETRIGFLRSDGKLGQALSSSTDPSVRAKEFVSISRAETLYARYTGAGGPEYSVDGLVLTPETLAVFQDRPDQPAKPKSNTWARVFKWKPPRDNSVDFLVQYDKTSNGDLATFGGKLRARLLVQVNDVAKGMDPYQVLTGVVPEKQTLMRTFEAPDYGLRRPGNPDSLGSGMFVHAGRDLPRCSHPPYDAVADRTVVEFSWNTESGTWVPLRVRYDKDGFPNKFETAISVWRSIAFPIELENIADPRTVGAAGPGSKDDVYFDDVAAGDGAATEPMRRFHGNWIKGKLLFEKAAAFLKRSGQKELRMLELAVGRGGDMNSWIANGYTAVVGVDLYEDNLVGQQKSGAYSRLLKAREAKRNADASFRYAFVPLDASRKIDKAAVEAIANPNLRKIGQSLWRLLTTKPDPKLAAYEGLAVQPFDVVSCQFAAHYFFESEEKLDAFLENVADNLRPGGLFIGTCSDGKAIAEELDATERNAEDTVAIEASDPAGNLIWRIEKRYGDDQKKDVYGKAIAVYIDTINKVNVEYLLDFDVMVDKLKKLDVRLLVDSELELYGVPASSALFSDVYRDTDWRDVAKNAEIPFERSLAEMVTSMDDNLRRLSFLNRYFIFVKA
jgi:SAM-dependent methyltransferase